MERDLRAAARIQEAFLPRGDPGRPGPRFAWHYRPCDELAGDGLNVVPLDDRHVGALRLRRQRPRRGLGAAVGLAQPGALAPRPTRPRSWSSRTRGEGRPRRPVRAPAEVADRLNRMFPFDEATEQYFTMVYGVLDVGDGRVPLRLGGAPRPGPRPGRRARRILEGRGFPIGLAERPLRGAPRPGPGRPPLPLLRRHPRGDGRRRRDLRRRPAARGARTRPAADRWPGGRRRCWRTSGAGAAAPGLRDDVSLVAVEFLGPSWSGARSRGRHPAISSATERTVEHARGAVARQRTHDETGPTE